MSTSRLASSCHRCCLGVDPVLWTRVCCESGCGRGRCRGSVGLGGGAVVESGLVSLAVVEAFGLVEQRGAHLASGVLLERSVHVAEIAFERGPRRLHGGVDAPIGQECRGGASCRRRGAGSPAIRVMNELPVGCSPSEGHDQGVHDEVGGSPVTHGPPGEALVVEVFDPHEVEASVAARELGDVRDRSLVGRVDVAFGNAVRLDRAYDGCDYVNLVPPPPQPERQQAIAGLATEDPRS
jgi:hypothetical protein